MPSADHLAHSSAPPPHEAASGHVAIRGLSKVFYSKSGPLTALSDINLTLHSGEFVSIIGPSGCGKSTLLRLVGGLLEPDSGTITIGGRTPQEAQRRKEISFVFQDPALLPWRNVLRNIALPLEINRGTNGHRPRTPQELLALVGLTDFSTYYPRQLSGGMQQRVALARALILDPTLLLMDEPFGALDEITREAMRYELLRLWQESRKTVLFVTHSIAEAVTLSDRVVVLSPRPGKVQAIVNIDIARPRGDDLENSDAFRSYTTQLRTLLRQGW